MSDGEVVGVRSEVGAEAAGSKHVARSNDDASPSGQHRRSQRQGKVVSVPKLVHVSVSAVDALHQLAVARTGARRKQAPQHGAVDAGGLGLRRCGRGVDQAEGETPLLINGGALAWRDQHDK
jgi:hypothetical protein